HFCRSCSIRDEDVRAGAGFGSVIVRAGKAVTDTNVVLTEEAEALGSIQVQSVVVAGGVFEVAKTLALKLTTKVRERAGGISYARGRCDRANEAARRALDQIRNGIRPRGCRCVIQVVMTPAEGSVEQPRRSHSAVIAHDPVAGAVLQLVVGARSG